MKKNKVFYFDERFLRIAKEIKKKQQISKCCCLSLFHNLFIKLFLIILNKYFKQLLGNTSDGIVSYDWYFRSLFVVRSR